MDSTIKFKEIYKEITEKADKTVFYALVGQFVFGLILAGFYDTWLLAILNGAIAVGLFYGAKVLFPQSNLRQYVAGFSLSLFMAQFIYQMHGMFEMHFSVFISVIILISYQNWRAFIVPVLFVVLHHGSFAFIQYYGYINNIDAYKQIYFTQLDYMDLTTFIFHAGLFAIAALFAAIAAFQSEKKTMQQSESFAKLELEKERTQNNIEFANQIAQGNFDSKYELDENDTLGRSLVEMRDSLKTSKKREAEERFMTKGLADIGEIIREKANDLSELSDNLVKYMVNYLDINQGAIFTAVEDENPQSDLEMTGCYAYNRKKHMHKRIEYGEGLVGQCAIERETIYLTEIPEDYIEITSGLGKALPKAVILVPLATDKDLIGVIELASFNEFEKYQIDFLNKVSMDIASAISKVKVNRKMHLLFEESQKQTEELRAQEEEIRQNMEEMQATQEEMNRQKFEIEGTIHAIESSPFGYVTFSPNGDIQSANQAFLDMVGFSYGEIMGQHHRVLVSGDYSRSEEYIQFWEDLARGISKKGIYPRLTKSGKAIKVIGHYAPVFGSNNEVIKIVKIAMLATEDMIAQAAEMDFELATNGLN